MGLGGALEIGKTGLFASQTAIEVAGNNLTNMATRGFHRRTISLAPTQAQEFQRGVFLGRGVEVAQVLRQVDEALEARIRNGVAGQASSAARQEILSQIEALENEFSDIDLSTRLSEFFNAWSELANNPRDNSLRSLTVQEGLTLSQFVRNLKTGLVDLRIQADGAIDGAVTSAEDLLKRIEQLNEQIVLHGGGRHGGPSLRDERDLLLAELSEFFDISIVEQSSGVVDVFVGSLPVVLNGDSRGLEVRRRTLDGELKIEVLVSDDKSILTLSAGHIGSLLAARDIDVDQGIDTLDQFANDLIFQVNRVHSQGQGIELYDSMTGKTRVADSTLVLTDEDAGLNFNVAHGSFQLHVTQKSTGQRTTSTINVDLDGIGNDTTLKDLAVAISAVPNVTGAVTSDGRLQITTTGTDLALGFSDDSSGVLAALGINSFFIGSDASDMDVSSEIEANLRFVAAAQNYVAGDNSNALAMDALRDEPLPSLNGLSLLETWNRHVEDYAIRLSQTQAQLDADTIVRENLEAQQQRVSGVNADEEAINLLSFQRTFQGSARFLQVVDELIETLLGLV